MCALAPMPSLCPIAPAGTSAQPWRACLRFYRGLLGYWPCRALMCALAPMPSPCPAAPADTSAQP
jgi:hypothetical protein